jgi:ATP-dependent RNA helicase DeaD
LLLQEECKTWLLIGLSKHTQINYCILDEADEMLNMGFYEDIVNILSTTPDEKTHVFCNNACWSSRIGKQFMKILLKLL